MPDSPRSASTPPSALEITTIRVVHAPRDRVFELFKDPTRLARWWGPKDFVNTFREFDFRTGGTWRFIMHAPDGGSHENHSTFLEIVRPERIVLRHDSAPPFKMTISLDERDATTHITWTMRFDTREERDKVAAYAVDANEENLDRLETELGA